MKIKFCGAATGVTGSCHLITTDSHKILFDCGQFQGGKAIVTDYLEDRPGVTEGELRFNDARLCFQQWHSCATCHPDGRSDGYEWSFPNADGLGRPEVSCDLAKIDMKKSTRRGRMATDIEIALFAMPDKEKVKAMTAYVESLGAKACGETRK